MNKIDRFRRNVAQAYYGYSLEEAARHGEALLREHWNNHSMHTPGYAHDIYNLARVYDEMGRFDRAVELYLDGSQLYAKLGRGDPVGYTNCLNNLAAVLYDMGQAQSAVHLFGQLASVRRVTEGEEDVAFADSLYNLANALTDKSHLSQAMKWHTEALKLRRMSGNREDVIDSLHSLAFLYEEKEEYEKALPLAQSAMELAQGDDYLCAVHYLARLHDARGQHEAALTRYEEAMELTRERVGRNHHSYLEVAANRAEVLNKMGRVREALLLQTEIRALLEAMDAVSQSAYTRCLREIAELHKQLGEYDCAERLFMRALRISRYYKRDLTLDIVCLIRLHLHKKTHDRAMEVLVYALMKSDSQGPGLTQLLTHLAVAFNQAADPVPNSIVKTLREMNDRERLAPIMKKWTDWENELFIPAVVMPPPAGPGTT